jgi:predicted nucleic acid-binding protein
MSFVLVDTSVWIDFFKGKDLPHVARLNRYLDSDAQVAICPPILQEILQGIRDETEFQITKEYLLELEILTADAVLASVEAALIFRMLRKKGVTIQKNNDCLIAWFAIHFNISLLHNDSDFDLIARHTSLNLM